MAPRAGTAAVVLIAVLFCLLVAPAPARRPVELPAPQVEPEDVDREASVEPLLPKPLESADAADAIVPEDEEVARTHAHARDGLVFRCDGDAAIVSSSDEPLSLDGQARPRPVPKVEEEEDTQERPYDSDAWDTECDTDSDDDEDDEGGIVGWFWRLADRLI